jgi:hypothetical protein
MREPPSKGLRFGVLLAVPSTCFAEGVLYFNAGGLLAVFVLYLLGLCLVIGTAISVKSKAKAKFALLSVVVLSYLLAPFLYFGWLTRENEARNRQIEERQQRNLAETRETLAKFCREYKGDAVPACRNRK